ncbi:SpoIID/LytB domain-containing protein [bacterium]|nr:SpoIID/LytB domain-containing protein [bacterium]
MGAKKFVRIFILSLILICSGFYFNVNAQDVRVAISNQNMSNFAYTDITVFALSKVDVYNSVTGEKIFSTDKDKDIQITLKDNIFKIQSEDLKKPFELENDIIVNSPTGLLGVKNLKRAGQQAFYRGSFKITKSTSKKDIFYLVNVIDVEEYLRGVVPNEMPCYFGLQALKAQAVAARNYALSPRTKAYSEFDLSDTVASQVYYGANTEKALSNQAIAETDGIVALYDWDLILAQYSSTAGGYTEYYDNVYGDGKKLTKPYLAAVPDNKSQKPLKTQEDVKEFYSTKPDDTYDVKSPYYRWQREWSKDELEDVLIKNITKSANLWAVIPENKDVDNPKNLKDITIKKHGKSGKILELEIEFENNKYTVSKELVIRRIFTKDGKALPSANVYFEKEYDNGFFTNKKLSKITAYGGGFGHGVGMSQWGAGYMATELKMPYSKILKHYYTDISLATIPVIISNDDEQKIVSQKFYASQKSARLVINNKFEVGKILVKINDKEVLILLERHMLPAHKYDAVDISKYIKKGENEITFYYPEGEGNNKAVRLYVELTGEDE